jgi:hypothetical protein
MFDYKISEMLGDHFFACHLQIYTKFYKKIPFRVPNVSLLFDWFRLNEKVK